jgi:hypothetical protein
MTFHFSFGDTTKGAIGFCAVVKAKNRASAIKRLKIALANTSHDDGGIDLNWAVADGPEYIRIYLNPDNISAKDIDSEGSSANSNPKGA